MNVGVAKIYELINFISKFEPTQSSEKRALKISLNILIRIIEPMIPHLAEECWNLCGNKKSLTSEPWPEVDKKFIVKEKATIVIQVNGKRRAEIETNLGATEADVMEEIKNIKNVSEHIEDSKVIKEFMFQIRF